MRKISLIAALGIVLFAACNKNKNVQQEITDPENENVALSRKVCASYDVLQEQLKANPGLQQKMNEIERFTQKVLANPAAYRVLADGTLEIPVWVNVLYRTAAQNISNAQIQSQIDVLNADFAATNSDYGLTPSTFTAVRSGDIKIRFIWSTANVTRKSTTKTSWSTNDAMKKSSGGGINPTNPTTTLNLWVCNLSGGILGYAQFPGGASSTDGVVIDDNVFGTTGSATAPFNKGRTATHEVGHWFNLRHIWGDATCGNDFVGDTPLHTGANYGCPAAGTRSTCTGTPIMMTMNYMDYTDDACMYMFTAGQALRMQATYAVGGPRAGLRP
ncbi:MAG: zinc metalloprotease [Chitinophagaceae bacterium]|nr:zinc metalloprotease [Chitinophagaceae bacterium]